MVARAQGWTLTLCLVGMMEGRVDVIERMDGYHPILFHSKNVVDDGREKNGLSIHPRIHKFTSFQIKKILERWMKFVSNKLL